jgi:acetyltransferase-like isoleucine patch superfamily enzyme
MVRGFGKLLRKIRISWDIAGFGIRECLFGFDNANAYLRGLGKDSIIPVLKKKGASIGYDCDIESPVVFHNCHDFSNLVIGNACHIGKNCFFDLRDKILIEDNVVISMQCTFITHIDLGKSELHEIFPSSRAPVMIKKNSYIGANSIVLKGIVLNDSCFVAAGSVVTRDVPAFTMVAGVPARIIKHLK